MSRKTPRKLEEIRRDVRLLSQLTGAPRRSLYRADFLRVKNAAEKGEAPCFKLIEGRVYVDGIEVWEAES